MDSSETVRDKMHQAMDKMLDQLEDNVQSEKTYVVETLGRLTEAVRAYIYILDNITSNAEADKLLHAEYVNRALTESTDLIQALENCHEADKGKIEFLSKCGYK